MAQTQYAYAGEARDPRTAAMLSMIPGLGQFYNGESRKGFLFLDVAIINYLLLSVILLAPFIVKMMQAFGLQFGMKVNHGVLEALKQMQFGSPVSLILSGMVLAFIGYAVRDAYDHAMSRRRRALYRDSVIELTEATSGSYIFHFSIIVALAVMALFFFIPKQPARQITEIEIFNSVVPAPKPKAILKTISEQNNQPHIKKFDETKKIQNLPQKTELAKQEQQPNHSKAEESKPISNPAHASSSSSSSSAAQLPKPITPVQIKPLLLAQAPPALPMMQAKPLTPATSMPKITATPLAPKLQNSATTPATPTMTKAITQASTVSNMLPKALPTNIAGASIPLPMMTTPGTSPAAAQSMLSQLASGSLPHTGGAPVMPAAGASSGALKNAVQLPATGSVPQLGGGPAFSPQAGTSSSRTGPSVSGTPGMMNIPTSSSTGIGSDRLPTPDGMGRGPHGTKTGQDTGNNNVPTPERPGHHGNKLNDGPIRIIPQVGTPGGGTQSSPTTDPTNFRAKPGDDHSGSVAEPDFSKFMAELQRRIKHSWVPPRDQQNKRIKVLFKIHTDGTLSNLRITLPSGSSVADQAALAAVQNASPFSHLPEHAPENVDIEFTFDYNVYNSRNF